MNYYLKDIADYLATQNITGVTIDFYQPDKSSQVALLSQGGETFPDQHFCVFDFQILVTYDQTNRKQARETANQIYHLLNNKQGKLIAGNDSVHFLKILATQPPYFLGLNSAGLSEFTTLYRATAKDYDLGTIYY